MSYKDVSVTDEQFSGSDIMLHVLSPEASSCKQIFIREIGNIYLEPSPNERSFRVYLNSTSSAEDNVLQITAPNAEESTAWVEGLLYAKAIQVGRTNKHRFINNPSSFLFSH